MLRRWWRLGQVSGLWTAQLTDLGWYSTCVQPCLVSCHDMTGVQVSCQGHLHPFINTRWT
jgi:hypothetical protein